MSFISVGMSDWSFLPSSSSAAPGKPPPSCLDTSAASCRFDASGRFHLSPSTSAYPMAASTLFPRVSRSCSTRWRRRWAPPERQATTRRSMRSRPKALFTLALALLCVSARFQGASSQHLASEIWTQLERRSTGLDSIYTKTSAFIFLWLPDKIMVQRISEMTYELTTKRSIEPH